MDNYVVLKTKSAKCKVTFLRTSFLKVQSIRLTRKYTGVVGKLTETDTFISTPMKKVYLAVHFTRGYLFINLLTEKLLV